MDGDRRWVTALHEAGHAVAAERMGGWVHHISLNPQRSELDVCKWCNGDGGLKGYNNDAHTQVYTVGAGWGDEEWDVFIAAGMAASRLGGDDLAKECSWQDLKRIKGDPARAVAMAAALLIDEDTWEWVIEIAEALIDSPFGVLQGEYFDEINRLNGEGESCGD